MCLAPDLRTQMASRLCSCESDGKKLPSKSRFCSACSRGAADIVRALLTLHGHGLVDLATGATILHAAVRSGSMATVEIVLQVSEMKRL